MSVNFNISVTEDEFKASKKALEDKLLDSESSLNHCKTYVETLEAEKDDLISGRDNTKQSKIPWEH